MTAPATARGRRVAVIGGGWAGLAAAVRATQGDHRVTVFEMAPQLGGRARSVAGANSSAHGANALSSAALSPMSPARSSSSVQPPLFPLDNGQHILIGAYAATLDLLREVGVDTAAAFQRSPLALVDPAGRGLRLPAGAALPAFARAVLAMQTWPWHERWQMLATASGWLLHGFRCPPGLTVAALCRRLGPVARRELIDPLCVSALNTASDQASASVFLRVLRDALFGGRGAADLMLPRVSLDDLLPAPAGAWLQQRGAELRLRQRVTAIAPTGGGWMVDGEAFDRVVLAATATEAARLARPWAPAWAASAAAFSYEPIITVYLRAAGATLAAPMTALPTDAPEREPAQFAFDHGQISGRPGLFAFVISGAGPWVARGLDAAAHAVRAQATSALRALPGAAPPTLQGIEVVRVLAERRATFACVPGLTRPPAHVSAGLAAAGDYIDGPYPATLEGAVRSAAAALQALGP